MGAIVTVDLGFGDAGKGSVVDYLSREVDADWVIRFNGGPQAAHNVVLPDGTHHTFSQFGSGTFSRAHTFLSRHMLVNPMNLANEAAALAEKGVKDPMSRIRIDADCVIITPFHVAMNRLRELQRGKDRHGSCGEGIGETMMDKLDDNALCAHDLDATRLEAMLGQIQLRYAEKATELVGHADKNKAPWDRGLGLEIYHALFSQDVVTDAYEVYSWMAKQNVVVNDFQYEGMLVFEAAQGILLDEWRGFHPYTTWSTCTSENAFDLLEGYNGPVDVIGICRSYMTRHGAGPFPTEDPQLDDGEIHNTSGVWQGEWRVGYTDLVLLNYAVQCDPRIDYLAVTNIDRLHPYNNEWQVCVEYNDGEGWFDSLPPGTVKDVDWQAQYTKLLQHIVPVYERMATDQVSSAIATRLQKPVVLESYGPTYIDKVMSK